MLSEATGLEKETLQWISAHKEEGNSGKTATQGDVSDSKDISFLYFSSNLKDSYINKIIILGYE